MKGPPPRGHGNASDRWPAAGRRRCLWRADIHVQLNWPENKGEWERMKDERVKGKEESVRKKRNRNDKKYAADKLESSTLWL
jgi:hypothetical protein